ncbi:NUMOD4 motif-containing HNH endonuclease [Mycobacterium sherrisii]|uniref:NUMOD4 motif-containing HNH endonuclease n=1 Tax=Mycobacterium sherrisii TaxID=243061 RepID=UPI00398EA7B1
MGSLIPSPERWLPVTGHLGFYEVSDFGRVKSLDRAVESRGNRTGTWHVRGRILKPTPNRNGYLRVGLKRDGRLRNHFVHKLVLEAFVCARPEGMECCHADNDRANNRLTNLRWDTRAANVADIVRSGFLFNAQKTHCPAGHEYSPQNTRIVSGRRTCVLCRREQSKLSMRRARARDPERLRQANRRYSERKKRQVSA